MRRALFAVLLAAFAVGCASAPKLPPKAGPEEVEFFNPNAGQYPPDGYKTIGRVSAERPLGTSNEDLILALRAEAARFGADAVILQNIRRTTEGGVGDISRDEMVIAEGLAIYWPEGARP